MASTDSMTDFAVDTKQLTKKFGRFVAVDNVDLQVSKGEIFGFLGANGAGKTTTIRILCGLLKPTSGKAFVDGIDVIRRPESVKKRLGYMSQRFSLYEDLKVFDNMLFFGGVYGLRMRQLRSRIEEISSTIGLGRLMQRTVKDLPSGWKQRLALACAILHDPPIIFLDEPTGGVDPVSRRSFWDLIYEMSAAGKTIFVTTHYMDEAEYCNRIAIMYQGRVLKCDSPSLIKAFTGDESLEDSFIRMVSDNVHIDRTFNRES